jgi:hypothetical protein
MVRRYLKAVADSQAYEVRNRERVHAAIRSVGELRAPLVLMRYSSSCALGKLTAHEEAREKHLLRFLDSQDEFVSFVRTFPTVFVSQPATHRLDRPFPRPRAAWYLSRRRADRLVALGMCVCSQWLGWSAPDPNNEHFRSLVDACDALCARECIDPEQLHVWLEYVRTPLISAPTVLLAHTTRSSQRPRCCLHTPCCDAHDVRALSRAAQLPLDQSGKQARPTAGHQLAALLRGIDALLRRAHTDCSPPRHRAAMRHVDVSEAVRAASPSSPATIGASSCIVSSHGGEHAPDSCSVARVSSAQGVVPARMLGPHGGRRAGEYVHLEPGGEAE